MVSVSQKKQKNKKTKKSHLQKNSHKKITVLIGSICISLILLGLGIYFIYINQVFSANFADNILRPTIGNKATIAIESFFFEIEDVVNKTIYSFVKANPASFTKSPTVNKELSSKMYSEFIFKNIHTFSPLIPLPGEGIWTPIYTGTTGAVMAKTFIRPDSQRTYAIAYLVKMNMNDLRIHAVAGIKEPGGNTNPGPGKIPTDVQESNKLVIAFNGGFQQKDGHYGMIVGDKEYLPLQTDLATLVMFKDSKPKILNYTGQNLGKGIIDVRQNGPLLLENSKDVTSSSNWDMQTWGLTTTNTMYTWRSGIGVTKDGDLIYVAGPSLVPHTLATALKAAGAVDAMQLDINPVWVRFIIFNQLGNGKYKYYSLTDNMTNGGYAYLSGYQKDFFYLVEK